MQQRNGQSRRSKQNQPGHRASSPPPHIVGRIVEMGFSPGQARDALGKIPSGMDVEAALELLLAQTTGHGGILEAGENRVERERAQREAEERERRRRRRAGPSRDSVKPRSRGRDEESEGDQAFEAETILAQASDLGQSVLSKASLFWNSGKERAMKVYEEQRKAMEAGEGPAARKGKAVRDGRPRWMVEAEGNGVEEGWRDENASGGFRDDDETSTPRRSVSDASSATLARQARDAPNRAGSSRHAAADETPYRSVKERADLLFGEEPKSYVPAARHRQTAASSTGTPRTASPAPPAPLPSRALVDAMSSQIQSSASFKAKGNDHLKLGRFPEAEAAYAAAINALPEGHLFLIPLYNNRAATRLKLGESASAANDCTKVIDLVGPSYHPSKEAPLPKKVAAEVKLADALVKATIKRAQAWEMGEKWKSAAEDWGRVMAFDGILLGPTAASIRNLAAEGGWRSKRMLEGVSSPVKPKSAPSRGAPRITVPPTKPVDVTESQAVTDLRKANRATEAEDGQRLALKDVVDTKLSVWKSGKESNLRALIASLDTALWDEILSGGLKVGMHELIAEKQVKIKYMKVIARLHPDKASKTAPFVFHCADGSQQLDLKNTTLEQRMLANGAFSALNDA